MKGKIYTLLLAVVAVAMAAGIFASCKDYGEDINNLQDQINKAALKSELTTAQSTLQKAADDAKQAADDAMAEARKRLSEQDFEEFANRLEKILRDHQDSLKTAFQKDLFQDEALKDTASNIRRDMSGMQSQLKNDIEGAKTYAEDKVNDLVRDYRLDRDKLLSTVEYNGVRTLLDRSEELLNMVDQIDSLDDFNKAAKKVDDFITLVNALTKAVTSVELIATFSDENSIDHYLANYAQTGKSTTGTPGSYTTTSKAPFGMAFYKGTQAADFVFGTKEVDSETIGGSISRLSKQGAYTKGEPIKDTVNILVRVSPVDADLSKLQAESEKNILIVNSQGEALDDWLYIGNPKKYGDLLSFVGTRATNIGSGLWVIPVAMKKDKDINEFMKVTHPEVKLNNSGELISNVPEVLYAVAIRNTAKNVDTRYAISTYDLVSTYENYKPATIFTFKVNNEFVENYYNRWTGSIIKSEQSANDVRRDYMWRQKAGEKVATPATTFNAQTDGAKAIEAKNANFNQNEARNIKSYGPIFLDASNTGTKGFYDERQVSRGLDKIITCEVGDPIVINSFIGGRPQTTVDGTIKQGNYVETRLDYYYVVIDHIGAIESDPSEIVSWRRYVKDIEGINKIYKVGEKCTIRINTEEAAGDIIGFRVYACNLDGTLADPDGRAFYVKVDKEVTHGKVTPVDASATSNDIVAKKQNDTRYEDNREALNIGTFKVNAPAGGWGVNGEDNELLLSGGVAATGVSIGARKTTAFTAADGGEIYISSKDYPSQICDTDPSDDGYSTLELRYWLIKELDANGNAAVYATKWGDVKYIKISAKNIEDWVDGSSIDFTITGYSAASATNPTAKNILDVTVRKALPTAKDIPADYQIKWNPAWTPAGSSLTYCPKIVNSSSSTTPWEDFSSSVTVTGGVIDFKSLTVNTADASMNKWYEWVIKNAAKADADLNLTLDNSFAGTIPVEKIGNTFDGSLHYAFDNISRTTVNPSIAADDYKVDAWSGKIVFENAMNLVKFKPATYKYGSSLTSESDKFFLKWSDVSNFFGYSSTSPAVFDTNFGATAVSLIVTGNSTTKEISRAKAAGVKSGINSSNEIDFTTESAPGILKNYSFSTADVTLTGEAAAYLTVTYDSSDGSLTFTKNTALGQPIDNYTGKLTIKGRDILGNSHIIVDNFEFTLLYNQ